MPSRTDGLVLLVLPMTLRSVSVEFLAKSADSLPGPPGHGVDGCLRERHVRRPPTAFALFLFWGLTANAVGHWVLRTRDA